MTKNIKMPLIFLAISVALIVCGIIFWATSCYDCIASNHGGMAQYICTNFYVPKAINIVLFVIGGIGSAISSVFLIFGAKSKPH